MRLSVVIPTRNRKESLRRVLAALHEGSASVEGGVEIVVVDDGSSDGTREELASWAAGLVLLGEHGGPAAARNRGVRAASGEIVVFLGDDTVPEPGFLRVHDEAHARSGPSPLAVLGYTTWDASRMRITPLLTHLNENGLQFGFALIRDPENVPFNFFYTSNVSLPRSLFLELGGFDESFPGAAWEDIELAYRATTRAHDPMRLVYRPEARALHDHPTTFQSFRRRQRSAGKGGAVLIRKHPELASWLGMESARRLPSWRLVSAAALGLLVPLADRAGVRLPGSLYDHVLSYEMLASLRDELSRSGDGA